MAISARSPAQSNRDGVIATILNVGVIAVKVSLSERIAPPPRPQLRGPDTGVTGTEGTVELGKTRKNEIPCSFFGRMPLLL